MFKRAVLALCLAPAWLLAAEPARTVPNDILIEGHTDARPFNARKDYSNWELSADRANTARRLMDGHGVRPGQIKQVRGFAEQNLRDKQHPDSASNRRVSVIVRYQNAVQVDEAAPAPAPKR